MTFYLRIKLPIGHSDAQPVAFLHLRLAPNRAPGGFVKGDRVPAFEYPQGRKRIQLCAELGVRGARFSYHGPSSTLHAEPEGDQAFSPAADWQAARIPELRGQLGELALIAAQHGPRVQAHQALTELGESLVPLPQARSLCLIELFLRCE